MRWQIGFVAKLISNCNQKSSWQVFLLHAVALGRLVASVPWDEDRFKPHALKPLGTSMKWKPSGNNPSIWGILMVTGSLSESYAHPDFFSFLWWVLLEFKRRNKTSFSELSDMMLPEENMREQTVTNCKPVLVDIELGFGAFGHCFLTVGQVRKGVAARNSLFFFFFPCLKIPPYFKEEMRENKEQTSALSNALPLPPLKMTS